MTTDTTPPRPIGERTTRATEALTAHYQYLVACRPDHAKDVIEGATLDPARDPSDNRYGHESFLYEGGHFQTWLRRAVGAAETYAVTDAMFTEIEAGVDMIIDEGIEFLPFKPNSVPSKAGFILFPRPIRDPFHHDGGIHVKTTPLAAGGTLSETRDIGMGAYHDIDGFFWEISDKVSQNGYCDTPVGGAIVMPFTRFRGDPEARPFRMAASTYPNLAIPPIVASDITAWAFDGGDTVEWTPVESIIDQTTHRWGGSDAQLVDIGDHAEWLRQSRQWMRALLWTTFHWLTDERWIEETPDRRTEKALNRERRKNPNAPKARLRVVDLRPERRAAVEKAEAKGEPPAWRNRWIVRGHWARRRYQILDENGAPVGPTRGPDAVLDVTYEYRDVYIEPHTKGPADAPLMYRPKVGVLNK